MLCCLELRLQGCGWPGPGSDLVVVLDGGSGRFATADRIGQALPQPPRHLLIRCPRGTPPPEATPELLPYPTVLVVPMTGDLSLARIATATGSEITPAELQLLRQLVVLTTGGLS